MVIFMSVCYVNCNFNTISENTGGTDCLCQNLASIISKLPYSCILLHIVLYTIYLYPMPHHGQYNRVKSYTRRSVYCMFHPLAFKSSVISLPEGWQNRIIKSYEGLIRCRISFLWVILEVHEINVAPTHIYRESMKHVNGFQSGL